MARTYIPTLVAQLKRMERYIERYDTVLNDNMTAEEKVALVNLLASVKALLVLSA